MDSNSVPFIFSRTFLDLITSPLFLEMGPSIFYESRELTFCRKNEVL